MGFVLGFTSLIVMALFRITPEIFDGAITPVVMATAFFSAVLGSLLAPIIQALMNVVADVRLPELPDLPEFRPPKITRRRKHDILKKGTILFLSEKGVALIQ